jgi:transcriptional regulator with XRE-family HTH domain
MDSSQITPEEWKAFRLAKGLTQHELAAVAGLSSQGVVSQVENGLKPGPSTERRLREALGLIGESGAVTASGKVTVTSDE